MGKRVDNIVIINNVAFIIEFKVGDGGYEKHAIEQVIDYTIDLKNFHEGSHDIKLIPVETLQRPRNSWVHHGSLESILGIHTAFYLGILKEKARNGRS